MNAGAGRGFTIIELMVAVTVAGILAAIAIPAFNSFVLNDRDASQINSLVYSFNYARSEAVKLNIPNGVTVCPATAGACNNSTAWSGGWIVTYVDTTVAPPAARVLQSVPALAGNNVLTATGAAATGITFRSTGAVALQQTLAIKVCDTRGGAYAHDVEVNVVGNVATSQKPGFDAKGAALACP